MNSIPSDSGVRSHKRSRGHSPAQTSGDPHLNAFLHALSANDQSALQQSLAALLESRGVVPPPSSPPAIGLSDFAMRHLARKAKKLKPATLSKMRLAITSFCRLHKAALLDAIVGNDVQDWVEGLSARGLSAGTVRVHFFCIFSVFGRAASLGLIKSNPCADVELPDEASVVNRLPLEDPDFEKLLAYLKAGGLWEEVTYALIMRYSSARLGDAAKMPCSAVKLVGTATLLEFTAAKTGKAGAMPVFEPLASHLRSFVMQEGLMCPELAKLSASCLSKRFTALLIAAGVDTQPVTLANGRVVRRVTAHSLRHAYIDGMEKLGVPEEDRMKLSAHVSKKAHRGYLHSDGMDLHAKVSKFFQ